MWDVIVRREVRTLIDALAGKRTGYAAAYEQLRRDPCFSYATSSGGFRPFAYRLSGGLATKVCGVHLERGYRLAFTMRPSHDSGYDTRARSRSSTSVSATLATELGMSGQSCTTCLENPTCRKGTCARHVAPATSQSSTRTISPSSSLDCAGSYADASVSFGPWPSSGPRAAIHDAGGVAVWAHPFWDVEAPQDVTSMVDRYRAAGLDGVEVFYATHTEEQTRCSTPTAPPAACS